MSKLENLEEEMKELDLGKIESDRGNEESLFWQSMGSPLRPNAPTFVQPPSGSVESYALSSDRRTATPTILNSDMTDSYGTTSAVPSSQRTEWISGAQSSINLRPAHVTQPQTISQVMVMTTDGALRVVDMNSLQRSFMSPGGAPSSQSLDICDRRITSQFGSPRSTSLPNSPWIQRQSHNGYIYQVRFKRAHKNCLLSSTAMFHVEMGSIVIIDADRGEDLGIVLAKIPLADFVEQMPTAGYRGRGFAANLSDKNFITRLATEDEFLDIPLKAADEEMVLQIIREKVVQRNLQMKILDAEYQFDRHKLTFFFAADRRIDFRELVSDLFSLYKTRIWMQQVDTATLPAPDDPGAVLARKVGFLPQLSGDMDNYSPTRSPGQRFARQQRELFQSSFGGDSRIFDDSILSGMGSSSPSPKSSNGHSR